MCILASAMQSAELGLEAYSASASSCALARFLPFLNCGRRAAAARVSGGGGGGGGGGGAGAQQSAGPVGGACICRMLSSFAHGGRAGSSRL